MLSTRPKMSCMDSLLPCRLPYQKLLQNFLHARGMRSHMQNKASVFVIFFWDTRDLQLGRDARHGVPSTDKYLKKQLSVQSRNSLRSL